MARTLGTKIKQKETHWPLPIRANRTGGHTVPSARTNTDTDKTGSHWFEQMLPGRKQTRDTGPRGTDATQAGLYFLYCPSHPSGVRFLHCLSFSGTFFFFGDCPSIPCLLLPILSFCWDWRHFLGGPSEPQSGRVSPGVGRVGGKQAWAPPQMPILRCSDSPWSCLHRCVLWPHLGQGKRGTVLILGCSHPASPGHLLCVSREGPSPPWDSVSLPVRQISLQLERFCVSPFALVPRTLGVECVSCFILS